MLNYTISFQKKNEAQVILEQVLVKTLYSIEFEVQENKSRSHD